MLKFGIGYKNSNVYHFGWMLKLFGMLHKHNIEGSLQKNCRQLGKFRLTFCFVLFPQFKLSPKTVTDFSLHLVVLKELAIVFIDFIDIKNKS